MLQYAASKPEKALSSLFVVDRTDRCQLSPARMSVSRVSLDVNTGSRNELLRQEEYIRRTLATEFVKEQSGMTANKGTQSKRGYKDLRRDREVVFSVEDVEWGGAIRGLKRREVSVERDCRSGEYAEKDHQFVQSGSSDLTTEQSAVYMAAESNSTRTTGSLDEDGCLLKLQFAAPATTGYGEPPPNEEADPDDEEEDNSSMPFPNTMQAACVSYDVHRPAACASLYDDHVVSQDWLAASSYDVKRPAPTCASYDRHQENNVAGEDWLQLRLGSTFSVPHMPSLTSSPSPCTLQLLPQEPDCGLMKEREKNRDLKLCSGDYTRQPLIHKQVELASIQARPPLLLQSYAQAENTRENFYTSLMKASCLPLPPADSVGQYTASPAKIPSQYTSTAEASLCPPVSPLDHHASHYVQQLQQLQENSMHYRAPLHVSQEQRRFESMSPDACLSLRDSVHDIARAEAAHKSAVSRPPLPDFVHQNWDQLASTPPACSIMQPVTSFRDLIASSFLKEPSDRYDNSIPLLTSLQQPAISQMWPAKFSSQNSSSSDPNERINANNIMESSYINNINMGCRSMTSWLSQALAATENLYVDQRLDDQLSPEASLAPSLTSRKQINAERRLAKQTNKNSNQPLLKYISRPTSRRSPGFWFALQPSQPEDCDADIISQAAVAKSMSYIRMKNGDVPISAVKKFLVAKLGLSHDSQVALACRGKLLEETVDLKSIQEEIWLSDDFAHKERLSFRSSHSNIHVFKDTIMTLTYQIS